MPDLTPDQIARHEFRSGFRGYDPDEVRAFLVELSHGVEALVAERDRLTRSAETGPHVDLEAEFATITREVGAVLEAARQAAESMRERAKAEATRWRSESLAEAEATRNRAQQDAIQLRSDAWSAAEQLLTQCQAEAARISQRAEAESLRVVGEAEREAHRLTANARREAEDTVRTARMEGERLSAESKARHDEIIEQAMRQSEAAQERTRALEARRIELMRELESVRSTLTKVEGEIDQRRERLGLSDVPEVGHVAFKEGDLAEPEETWVPGETVRVVKPGSSDSEVGAIVTPQLKPEIRVLSAGELAERRGEKPPAAAESVPVESVPVESVPVESVPVESVPVESVPAESVPAESVPDDAVDEAGDDAGHGALDAPGEREAAPLQWQTSEPETDAAVDPTPVANDAPAEPRRVGEPPDETEPDEPQAREPAPETVEVGTLGAPQGDDSGQVGLFDDVEGLFDRLRTDEHPISSGRPATAGEDEPMAARRLLSSIVDPLELRDRLLLPVGNRALRNLKRQLTDEQNVVLEEIRLHESSWEPDREALRDRVRADLVVLHAESFGAGHSAAEELVGGRTPRPATPRVDAAADFAEALATELAETLAEGRAMAHGARQLGASLSRVFRAWRTDHAERRVRELALRAYHDGLLHSLVLAQGLEPIEPKWILGGRRCAGCRAAAEQPLEEFPPLHPGCECTIGL
jgi:DivIVA domain-containing protein